MSWASSMKNKSILGNVTDGCILLYKIYRIPVSVWAVGK